MSDREREISELLFWVVKLSSDDKACGGACGNVWSRWSGANSVRSDCPSEVGLEDEEQWESVGCQRLKL